jgi:hypothetical protein
LLDARRVIRLFLPLIPPVILVKLPFLRVYFLSHSCVFKQGF